MSCCVLECCDTSLFDTFAQKQPQELEEEQSQTQTARFITNDTITDPSTTLNEKKTKSIRDSNSVVSSNTEVTVSFDQDDSNTIAAQTKEPSTSISSSNTCDLPLLDSSDPIPLDTFHPNPTSSTNNNNEDSQPRSRSFMVAKPITRSTSTAVNINRCNIDANNKASPMNIRSKSFAYQPNASSPHIDISDLRALATGNHRAVAPAPPESPLPTSPVTTAKTATTTSPTVKKDDIVEPVKEDDFVEPVKAVLLEHRRRVRNTPPLPRKSPTPKITNSNETKTTNTSSPADVPSRSSNSSYNNNTRSLKELAHRFPDATPEEHYRFLTGKGGDVRKASKQLEAYLAWRQIHGVASNNTNNNTQTSIIPSSSSLDEWHSCASHTISDDENDWNTSALSAISSDPTYGPQPTSTYPKLPRLARFDDSDGNDAMRGRDNNRILYLTPARLDVSLVAEETYALCIALYLDRCLDRSSTEKITICIDVRSGHGWANPPARSIVPFIKAVVGVLETNFPERLGRAIVYPLPWTATAVWKVAKLFLDPNTARKMVVIKGPAEKDSKAPVEKLEEYIERDVLERMERNRVSTFVKRRRKSLGF